jgi:hypothetical protein
MRLARLTLCCVALSLAACTAKTQLIPRSQGRVDGERSTASYSDEAWRIAREPAPAEPAPETPAP